jgi:mRNA-degrading endonuclease RelE of RelBE toxin-antitoxin system
MFHIMKYYKPHPATQSKRESGMCQSKKCVWLTVVANQVQVGQPAARGVRAFDGTKTGRRGSARLARPARRQGYSACRGHAETRPGVKEVEWTETALEHMAALDKGIVRQAVERFADTGVGNVKRLQGIDPPEYRLRVGDYRVRFHQEQETLRILRVRNRREAYR